MFSYLLLAMRIIGFFVRPWGGDIVIFSPMKRYERAMNWIVSWCAGEGGSDVLIEVMKVKIWVQMTLNKCLWTSSEIIYECKARVWAQPVRPIKTKPRNLSRLFDAIHIRHEKSTTTPTHHSWRWCVVLARPQLPAHMFFTNVHERNCLVAGCQSRSHVRLE